MSDIVSAASTLAAVTGLIVITVTLLGVGALWLTYIVGAIRKELKKWL